MPSTPRQSVRHQDQYPVTRPTWKPLPSETGWTGIGEPGEGMLSFVGFLFIGGLLTVGAGVVLAAANGMLALVIR